MNKDDRESTPGARELAGAPVAPTAPVAAEAAQVTALFERLRVELGKVIVGQRDIIDGVLTAFFCGGHVLLEGVPGIGKTMLVRALADATALQFSRVQFTPDLMPADIIGTDLLVPGAEGGRELRFAPGPIFANVLLADEINRATPKTQSALLEAMQEQQVTVGGVRRSVGDPFFVLATQNPIEMEGTYPLPEAQLDRFFFKLVVNYPGAAELAEIVDRTTVDAAPRVEPPGIAPEEFRRLRRLVREVVVAPEIRDWAVRLLMATHPQTPGAMPAVKRFVRYGASPRGLQALVLAGKVGALLAGRYHVARADVARAVLPALRHRIILNFEGEAEGVAADEIIGGILAADEAAGSAAPVMAVRR